MNLISDILFWISNGLLVPVVVLLIILFIRSLLLIGSFFGQYLAIRRTDALLRQQLDTLTIDTLPELEGKLPVKSNSLVIAYIRRVLESKDRPAHVQRLLADFEITADKDLAISKTLTKMGPMLGLMGTLIPMGPALVGLSTGDIASMAYNMQVAFATTVVGLFSSAIGFITQQVKQRWYLQDMTNLEFLSELLTENIQLEMKRNLLRKEEDSDPMSVVSNLFDVAMVFAVALMVALVTRYNMTEMFSQEDFTMVKNPGKENMEIITKEGQKINRYTPSEDQDVKSGKKGKKVGIAYELDNGEIIYVPEE